MSTFLKRVDPLVAGILVAALLAFLLPASGAFADGFGIAVKLAIALLFFLYGARLSTREALQGLTHWRLHLAILACTFVVYPLIGLSLRPLASVISWDLYLGILFLTLVPSTVQSSVALTGLARGNVGGAIVAASLSSLVGVVVTPLLVMVLMGSSESMRIDASVFLNIAAQLLLPFALGQLAGNVAPAVKKVAKSPATKVVDRGSIWMVVYAAFSQGVVAGIWDQLPLWELGFLVVFSAVLVLAMLWVTRVVPGRLGFDRADTVAIQQCGVQKSLATGLPMASVMFGGATLGALIIPLMIYHTVQLMVCSWYVSRYAGSENASIQ